MLSSGDYDDIKLNIEVKLPIAKGVSDTTKEYKDKISNTIKEIKKLVIYDNYDSIKSGILKTKDYVEEIIMIIKELDKRVSEYKSKYNYFEYGDISSYAIELVKNNTEIREEIKNNLNEIMIDEYQDTNDVQEEFIAYISNNNVYMVGDIKQSIYRFRNANPYIFKNKYDSYSKNINGIKIDLNKNFRSREEVINNINLMFDRIMNDTIGGASYKASHRMVYGNPMYQGDGDNGVNNNFEVYSYLNDTIFKKDEVEAFIIASDIKNKIILFLEFKKASDDKSIDFYKYLTQYRTNQPKLKSLGSTFKNNSLYQAGKLLDKHGLKGVKYKNFEISTEHANFIIVNGDVKSEDLYMFIVLIQIWIYVKCGIVIEPEINRLKKYP